MTLQEALKSGRPFKRSAWKLFIIADRSPDFIQFDAEEVLAEDWVLKPEPPPPMEIWVNVYCGGISANAYRNHEDALKYVTKHGRTVKFREVRDGE